MPLTYKDKASIKLDRQQKNINPVDYAVWGALQQDVLQSSDRGFGGSQRQCVPVGPVSTNNWSTKQLIRGDRDWKLWLKFTDGTLNSCLLDCLVVVWSFNCFT